MRPFRLFADISSNNNGFDAQSYRRAGHRLIAIKATEGIGYINPEHALWSREAHGHGIRVLHYHFCRPPAAGLQSAEAATFWSVVKPTWQKGDLMAFDLETTGGQTYGWLRRYLGTLDTHLATISGHHARLYSGEDFIRSLDPVGEVAGGLCWAAAYGLQKPVLPRGLRVWAWQYTDGTEGPRPHAFAGVGRCDGSVLNLASALRLLGPA